jgi:hypothetical protein
MIQGTLKTRESARDLATQSSRLNHARIDWSHGVLMCVVVTRTPFIGKPLTPWRQSTPPPLRSRQFKSNKCDQQKQPNENGKKDEYALKNRRGSPPNRPVANLSFAAGACFPTSSAATIDEVPPVPVLTLRIKTMAKAAIQFFGVKLRFCGKADGTS